MARPGIWWSTRRRFLGLGVGAALGACAGRTWPGLALAAADGPGGVVALPRGREIVLVRADGSNDQVVVLLQPGEFIADVALSPDASRIAFGVFRGGASGPSGSDIAVAPVEAAGSGYSIVVPRDRPGMLLAAPYWAPDGAALVFEGIGIDATGKPVIFSDWAAADGSGRRTLVEDGRYPALSPDGREVAYVRSKPSGDSLYVRPLDGGAERQLLSEAQFVAIIGPRYSPDGSSIAFSGVQDRPAGFPKLQTWASEPTVRRGVAGHGMPSDPYVVPSTGGDARQIAALAYDDLAVAWSPDAAWLAVSGAAGLKLVRVADGSIQPVGDTSSFGAIDWR
jgi:Tol biopolymer transport system component